MRNRKPLLIILLLFVLSGAMLTVIQAPIGWSLLAWGALVPFALACTPSLRPRTLAWMALGIGYLYWLVSVYWIVPITIIGWLGMSLYLSLFWLLPALAVRFSRAKGFPLFIALPILAVGWERLQGFPMGGFFWRFLGHSQYQNLAMIQIADLFGAAGVSFVVAMVNGLLVDLILFISQSRRVGCAHQVPSISGQTGGHSPPYEHDVCPLYSARRLPGKLLGSAVVATVLVVSGTVLYGQWRLRQAGQCVTDGPLVASLQSNVPISVKRSFKASVDIFDELMGKSQAAASAGADLIVWPETMVQANLQPELWSQLSDWDWEEDRAFHQALGQHAKDTAYVLVGAYGAEVLPGFRGKPYLGKYNSAYLYRTDGTRDPMRYDKIHLVLFGEYIPFRWQIPWLFEQLKRFLPKGYNPDYSLEHGTRYTLFEMASKEVSSLKSQVSSGDSQLHTSNFKLPTSYHFGVIICYEDTIPYVARNFALDPQGRKQVDWLVNISNDGWFVRFNKEPARVIPSTELPQHAAICAFRAVENRLPIIRSVNTGISCLIESTGRIRDGYIAASDGFPRRSAERIAIAGWFLDRLPIDKRVTFYSRHGEWFADGCAVLFTAALVCPLGTRLTRRHKQASQTAA
ncbi:MAG: apolipoprotein N-acyltransferase [Phycisphaerae bacterium]|nr:apolipoprotein N-acyltransferase [Phycisphaerae bacterium]